MQKLHRNFGTKMHTFNFTCDKVVKNGASKTCGRQPLKKVTISLKQLKQNTSLQIF